MMMKAICLAVCCLLIAGCSKNDSTPDEENGANNTGNYFEVTISGPLVDGNFKWGGNTKGITNFTGNYEYQGGVIERAMIRYYFDGSEDIQLIGGMEITASKGRHSVTDMEQGPYSFTIGIVPHDVVFKEQHVEVTVTEYKDTGGEGVRLLERFYGTFEGTVQVQNPDHWEGLPMIHTVSGKFGYSTPD